MSDVPPIAPGAVRWIARTLEDAGYETWAVGGAVRFRREFARRAGAFEQPAEQVFAERRREIDAQGRVRRDVHLQRAFLVVRARAELELN